MIVPSRDEFPRKRVQVGIVLNMAFFSMESEVEAVVTGCCFRRDPCNCPPRFLSRISQELPWLLKVCVVVVPRSKMI